MKRIKIFIVVGLVLLGTTAFAFDYFSPANPASPISPLNPANPASPLNPINMRNVKDDCGCTKELEQNVRRRTVHMYEYCYKDKCVRTESSKTSSMIRNCLNNGGGMACLNKY